MKTESFVHRKIEGREEESPVSELELVVDGEKVGIANLEYHSKPSPFYDIVELRIKPGERGKGFGSKIMAFIENWLREIGTAGVLTDAVEDDNSPAIGMYERHGWQLIPGSTNVRVSLRTV